MKQFIITVVDFGQFFYDRLNSCVRGQLEPVPVFVCSFLFLCLYVRDYYFCIIVEARLSPYSFPYLFYSTSLEIVDHFFDVCNESR